MSLIKTFKLRNKLEIDVLVNDELLLTITRPILNDENDTNDVIHFNLLDGYAEMYPNEDPSKQNSFIYFSCSGGNQMALVLTENEADELLKLSDNTNDSEYDSDYEPDTDTDTDSTPTMKLDDCFELTGDDCFELRGDECCNESGSGDECKNYELKDENNDCGDECKNYELKDENNNRSCSESQLKCDLNNCGVSGELQERYIKVIVLDRQPHPNDSNFYIYKIDIGTNQEHILTCVSDDFYKVGDLVNVDCYNTHWAVKGISLRGVLSEYKQEESDIEEVNSRFSSWFGF